MRALSTLVALAACSPAALAVDVRFEVAPLVTVPFGPFLDGQATTLANFDLGELELGGGVQDVTVLTDLSNGTGGGLSLAVLLNNWEIRYEFAVLPYDKLTLTHLGIVVNDLSLYFATEDLLGETLEGDASELDAAIFQSLGFGYRFEPFPEWTVSPYVPLGVGFAVAAPRNGLDMVLGFNIQLGFGAHARIGSVLDLGLAVRYGLSVFKNPDTSISALQEGASASVSTGSSAFDAAVEVFQALSISLTAAFWL